MSRASLPQAPTTNGDGGNHTSDDDKIGTDLYHVVRSIEGTKYVIAHRTMTLVGSSRKADNVVGHAIYVDQGKNALDNLTIHAEELYLQPDTYSFRNGKKVRIVARTVTVLPDAQGPRVCRWDMGGDDGEWDELGGSKVQFYLPDASDGDATDRLPQPGGFTKSRGKDGRSGYAPADEIMKGKDAGTFEMMAHTFVGTARVNVAGGAGYPGQDRQNAGNGGAAPYNASANEKWGIFQSFPYPPPSGTGGNGGNGGDGADGGKGGSVRVYLIKNGMTFKNIEIEREGPGEGGRAGKGGKGGKAGRPAYLKYREGYHPGRGPVQYITREYYGTPGTDGYAGKDGKPGARGAPGKVTLEWLMARSSPPPGSATTPTTRATWR